MPVVTPDGESRGPLGRRPSTEKELCLARKPCATGDSNRVGNVAPKGPLDPEHHTVSIHESVNCDIVATADAER